MLKTGLVSISFRKLSASEIIRMVRKSGLDAIEWGGDIHVPHGDLRKAAEVGGACELSGISCPSYGSYYRVGDYPDPIEEFKKVLESARILKSNTIRVWAGTRPTKEADEEYWKKVTGDLTKISDIASSEGMDIALEFHANTLTDNSTDTIKLIAKADAPNLTAYWQPPVSLTHAQNLHDIRIMKQHISNIHTFTWDGREKLPLEDGYDRWLEYLKLIDTWKIRYCLLEFIKDDSIEGFFRDAETIKQLVKEVNAKK